MQIDDFEFIQVPQQSSIELANIITDEINQRKYTKEEEDYVQIDCVTQTNEEPSEIQLLIRAQIQLYSELKQKYRKMEYEMTVSRWKECMAELKGKKSPRNAGLNLDMNLVDLREQLNIYQQFAPHILTQVYARNFADPSFEPLESKVLAVFEIISRMFLRRMHCMNATSWSMVRHWHDSYDPATLWAIAEVDTVFDYFYAREIETKRS